MMLQTSLYSFTFNCVIKHQGCTTILWTPYILGQDKGTINYFENCETISQQTPKTPFLFLAKKGLRF